MKALASARGPHHWLAALLAISIPAVIVVTFVADVGDAEDAPEQIIYVESWKGDRSLEETRANIRAHEERRKAFEEERRRSFQRLQDLNNKLGI